MVLALLCGDMFEYHQGFNVFELGFLFLVIVLVLMISRNLFKVKLENNLFSEEELTQKPLYSQKDLLLQEKPIDFHRQEAIDEIPVLTKPSWLARVFIFLAIVGFFVIPLSTIWLRYYY